jgi:hypothetical protein
VTRFGTSTRELAEKARADPVERATSDPSFTGGVAVLRGQLTPPRTYALPSPLVAPNTTVPANPIATIIAPARPEQRRARPL